MVQSSQETGWYRRTLHRRGGSGNLEGRHYRRETVHSPFYERWPYTPTVIADSQLSWTFLSSLCSPFLALLHDLMFKVSSIWSGLLGFARALKANWLHNPGWQEGCLTQLRVIGHVTSCSLFPQPHREEGLRASSASWCIHSRKWLLDREVERGDLGPPQSRAFMYHSLPFQP